MAIRPIVTSDKKSLRKPSVAIANITKDYEQLVADMRDSMHEKMGVGIAAPQIGVNEQVAIITQGEKRRSGREEIVIINPKFLYKSEEMDMDEEGCLSIPGIFGPVERHAEVQIEYQDLQGKKHRLRARDFNARVIQHELDHLVGILFVDHVEDPTTLHPVTT